MHLFKFKKRLIFSDSINFEALFSLLFLVVKTIKVALLCVLLFFFSLGTIAEDYPKAFSSTKLLEVGRTRFYLNGSQKKFDKNFDKNGRVVNSQVMTLNKLTWGELIEKSPKQQKEVLSKQQKELGKSSNDIAIAESISFETTKQIYQFFWGLGLLENWSIGTRIPLISVTRSAQREMQWVDSVSKRKDIQSLGLESTVENDLTSEKGLNADQYIYLGDVEFIGNYLISSSTDYGFSVRQKIVLPTSPPPNPYSIEVDRLQEGQTDFGLDLLQETFFKNHLIISSSIGYLWQFADRISMRIPSLNNTYATSDVEYGVKRNPGDLWTWSQQMKWNPMSQWEFRLGYQFQKKYRDNYSGSEFQDYRYDLLSLETESKRFESKLGVSYFAENNKTQWWNPEVLFKSVHIDYFKTIIGSNIYIADTIELGVSLIY